MINSCGNCVNYVWGDKKTPLPSECITCTTTHVPNGQHPTPSHWKAKPQTNADRIRAMSDKELTRWLLQFVIDCAEKTLGEECEFEDGSEAELQEWLKQPAEGE